jgi:hypothetical protein
MLNWWHSRLARISAVSFLSLVSLLLVAHHNPFTQPKIIISDIHNQVNQIDLQRLSFTDSECTSLFPHAFDEIDRAKSQGYVGSAPLHVNKHGYVRARIYDGAVSLTNRSKRELHSNMVALSALCDKPRFRRLAPPIRHTIPNPPSNPNISFSFRDPKY